MIPWLFAVRINTESFQIGIYAVSAVLLAYLFVRMPIRSWAVRSVVSLAAGLLIGVIVTWLVSDVWNVFGVAMTIIAKMWASLAFAGVSLAVANLWKSRWWRKAIAIVSIPVFLASAGVGINVDFGAYRNLNDVFEISPYSSFPTTLQSSSAGTMDPQLGKTWQAPLGIRTHGEVGLVQIPSTQSKFTARPAAVYLPPAALVAQPPVLPVLVLFSGQPGAPSDLFTSGHLAETLDAWAAKHGGLAPIVVVPDQLGLPSQNPMCIDSHYGNVETYITTDVAQWIRSHLHVSDSARYWAVGGYSQGGTCSIQFGAGHPEIFGSVIDILGEIAPTIGAQTVSKVFGGSQAAYDAIKPLTVLAKMSPYSDSVAFFGAGKNDARYDGYAHKMNAAAQKAGMSTQLIISPHSGHDWNTVRYVFDRVLPDLITRLGLGS